MSIGGNSAIIMGMSESIPVEVNGHEIKQWKNGSLYDTVTHRIIQAPPLENRPIRDADTGRALVQRRWDKHRQTIAAALTEEAALRLNTDVSTATEWDGLRLAYRNIASIAIDRHGKEAVMAMDLIARNGDYVPDRRSQASSDDQIPVSIDVQQANIVLQLIVQSVVQADLGSNPTYQNVSSRKSDADDASTTIIDGHAHDEPDTGSV